MDKIKKDRNLEALIIQIAVTLAITFGLAYNAVIGMSSEAGNLAAEVFADYTALTNNYIRAYKVLKMEAVEMINRDPSFDEMQSWLQQREPVFKDAVGKDVYDGFAFTYKGGYAHSWNYGDYTNYVPDSRPWYRIAKDKKGEIAVVAPYATFLSGTSHIKKYDNLRMSIAQRYNNEISFDFDLDVKEINALLDKRATIYTGTKNFLFDANGFILSSTNAEFYGHNVKLEDDIISKDLSEVLQLRAQGKEGLSFRLVDGSLAMVYSLNDTLGNTVVMLVPFWEFFQRNLFFVFLLALLLLVLEIGFFYKNKKHLAQLEESRLVLKEALAHAEEASHAKGDFMSRMSHEIRTPLNAVIGYLEIAQEDSTDQEKVQHCLEKSHAASRHLLSIINDVLDISSIESGRMKLANEKFDIKQMVNSLTVLFYAQAKNKGVAFSVQLEPLDSELLIGDELRIRQILLNLLSNAIKFTPAGGRVLLGLKQLSNREGRLRIEFKVQDTGIGMSEEYRARMFKPFEQESAATAKNYGGTGLGLSISNNLVHMMGGTIEVESTVNVGTTFKVVLAFDSLEQELHSKAVQQDFSKLKVLVVDDDRDACNYMEALLKRMNIKCDIVDSGKKALRRVASRKDNGKPYDLCIIDWYMKDMDGMETAKEVREICGQELPIIIATAYDYTDLIDAAKEIGVNKIVSKPLFQSTLLDLLVSTYGKYQPTKPVASPREFNFKGTKLILAEDNEMNMEIALDILRKAGLDITPAVNGREALDLFEASAPGTFAGILMDVQMPVMDGYTATRKIRESSHPQAKTIPIIAMTANAFSEDVTAALSAGMNDHVSKPISYDKLFNSLNKFVGDGK